MKNENLYRILVATTFILLMVLGIYIGTEITDKSNKTKEKNVVVSNTSSIKIYDEEAVIEEEKETLGTVDVKYVDIYPDCGHNIESKEHQEKTTKEMLKKEIEDKDLGYRLIGEQEGILIYQKVHVGKCMNHYMVKLENDIVVIYRMNENGEFAPYQTTEITSQMLRSGISEQLQEGIIVDDIEELFLLMEDIES